MMMIIMMMMMIMFYLLSDHVNLLKLFVQKK